MKILVWEVSKCQWTQKSALRYELHWDVTQKHAWTAAVIEVACVQPSVASPTIIRARNKVYILYYMHTWSSELSLISAHLEKTAFWASFLEVGVFASYCSSLEKSGCLFPSNWRLFPSYGRLFPSHARKWAFFFEVKWASFSWKMKLAEISAKWVSRYILFFNSYLCQTLLKNNQNRNIVK